MLKWCVNTQRKRSFSMSVMKPLALWMWWGRTWSPGIVQGSVLNVWLPLMGMLSEQGGGRQFCRSMAALLCMGYTAHGTKHADEEEAIWRWSYHFSLFRDPCGDQSIQRETGSQGERNSLKNTKSHIFPPKNNWPYSLFISVQKCICPIHLVYDCVTLVTEVINPNKKKDYDKHV